MMTVLVKTLLTLFVVKWALVENGAGEAGTLGHPSKLPLTLHLMTLHVIAEIGAPALTASNTTVVIMKIFTLSVMVLVSVHAVLSDDYLITVYSVYYINLFQFSDRFT